MLWRIYYRCMGFYFNLTGALLFHGLILTHNDKFKSGLKVDALRAKWGQTMSNMVSLGEFPLSSCFVQFAFRLTGFAR